MAAQPYSLESGGGFGSTSSQGPNDVDSGIFATEGQRHDELKNMLESSKEGLKLEAMKRTIGMVAKGRNVADLFPHVVKNVLTKNNELKKLVYVYLVRYAEEEQDLALLSISAFQRALKDPNQLIRASALRVLSSIRVPVIVPIMMLSIKESSSDMSPFVRKTAAHAIPKLYSLDETQKEALIEVIEKLLKDKTTLVAGSAVMAFELVCPERIDLVHKNYRKLCNLMADIDEWGQVAVMHMLTRYARSQFLDPNTHEDAGDAAFYTESESEEEDEEKSSGEEPEEAKKKKKKPYSMDADHRLLLRSTKPLLQSRNSAVVMAVCQLYFHIAPISEMSIVIKPMLRLLHSHREVQVVVLTNIATLSLKYRGMFEPYIKSFYVHSQDPSNIRNLKLEILTNVATESSVSTILREFQTYVTSPDREFVAATIHAIGRCASQISDVTEGCVSGLVRLLQHQDESVVGESVVIIKKLLQLQPDEHKDITVHLTKLVDKIKVPMARASILWLIGEYSSHVLKLAPDVLRKMAKVFPSEEDIVKLQILNLAGKLLLSNPKQSRLLCQYVFNMAKYDVNYDIRDRARFLRQLLLPAEKGALNKHAKRVLLASKPPPVLESEYKDRQDWQVGSLSHMLNAAATGYQPLPDFPEEAPDPSAREVEVEYGWPVSPTSKKSKKKKNRSSLDAFYSDEESDSDESDEYDSDYTDDDSEKDSDEYSDEEEDSEEGDEESDEEDDDEDSDEEESDEESEEESSDEEETVAKPTKKKPAAVAATSKSKAHPPKQEESLLLLDDLGVTGSSEQTTTLLPPAGAASAGSFLQPTTAAMQSLSITEKLQVAGSTVTSTKSHELLHRIAGRGLAATYRFTRRPHIASDRMVNVEISISNHGSEELNDVTVGNKKLEGGMVMMDFQPISTLEAGQTEVVTVGVDFKDTLNPAAFDLSTRTSRFPVKISPSVGELVEGVVMAEAEFNLRQGKLRGMNESSGEGSVSADADLSAVCRTILEVANLASVSTSLAGSDTPTLLFAGQTVSGKVAVLLTVVRQSPDKVKLTVNCEKMVISSMLVKEVKGALKNI